MMNIPISWILVGSMIAVSSSYVVGHYKGWNQRDSEMQIEIAKKNEEARKIENKLNEEISAGTSKLIEANNAITQKQTALDHAIRAGRVRLPSPSCVQAPSDPAPSSGDRNQERGQPDRPADQPSDAERETLALIAALIAEGDRNTNQLNQCIDSYNKVREQINGKS